MEQQSEPLSPRQKVLHIITKGTPFGGAQKYVFELATRLPVDRFESIVVTGKGEDLPKALREHNIRTITLPSLGRDIHLGNDIQSFIDLVTVIRTEKPNIVHLNSSKIGGLGGLAIRWIQFTERFRSPETRVYQNIRSVFTAHAWAFNEDRPLYQRYTILFLHWLTILLTDATIVVAEKTRQDMLSFPLTRKKMTTIYTGMDAFPTIPRNQAREELSAAHGIPKDTLWIGTLAELHRSKGIDLAIEALGRLVSDSHNNTLPSFSFLVFGGGSQKEILLEKIETLGLKGKVFLLGPTPNAKKYLPALDIFSLTSRTEALPLVLLEAGLCGLPCLSTYVGGIPEIIRNGISGVLVEPESAYITQGFETLLLNPDKRTLYGNNLKKKVETSLSMQEMLERVTDVYLD